MANEISKYQNYETVNINRSELRASEYNPRKISSANKKRLKERIKKSGMVMPIVFNKRTGRIVSGHQRIEILDELHRKKDYVLTVSQIDVDEKEEVELNIFLNNVNAMGEYDPLKLAEVKELFPDLNFESDLGFDGVDLKFMEFNDGIKLTNDEDSALIQKTTQELEAINERRKIYRTQVTEADKNKDGAQWTEHNDYSIAFVFKNNKDKRDFMEKIGKPENDKILKYEILFDLAKGKFNQQLFA